MSLIKKVFSLLIIFIILIAGIFVVINENDTDEPIIKEIQTLQTTSISYTNYVDFNQHDLQLEKEVIQFEITFHHDDVVDVSSDMYVYYLDETITSIYCLLSDGEKPLLIPGGPTWVPYRKRHIITPRMRISVGRWRLINILNNIEGFRGIGIPWQERKSFEVQAGDTWYLTLAIPTSAKKAYFSIVLSSLNDSMQITQLQRHGNVGFYSADYNQFSGNYYSIGLRFLAGFTKCDVYKQITTEDGSIINFGFDGHRKGTANVHYLKGNTLEFDRGIFSYLGNETGTWKFTAEGQGRKIAVYLLYIDIDPHIKEYLLIE